MKILPVNRNFDCSQNPNFGAKLSNIMIKDSVAENITKFIDEMKVISKEKYPSSIKIGKTTFNHSKYCAGWQKQTEKRYISVDFDPDDKLYSVCIINKEKNPDGKVIIKSFDYYLGTPTAINPVPEISYAEFEAENFKKGLWQNLYKEGSEVPDKIADLMNKVVVSTLKYMGKM